MTAHKTLVTSAPAGADIQGVKTIVQEATPKLLVEVPSETKLRRFMDLPKLFDLILNNRLTLTRLGKLIDGDPFECASTKDYGRFSHDDLLKLATELGRDSAIVRSRASTIQYDPMPSWDRSVEIALAEEINSIHPLKLESTVWSWEFERLKSSLKCCCWYGGEKDSDAMWRIYASHLGVAITTSVQRLEQSIRSIAVVGNQIAPTFHISAVSYDDKVIKSPRPWLVKREAFIHEQEVRLWTDWYSFSAHVTVDLSELVESIEITPFAPEWQANTVRAAVQALLGQKSSSIPVLISEHMRRRV
jgi:hypothetical protein